MELVVIDTLRIGNSRLSRTPYVIDFDAGEWRLATSAIGERSTCKYRLRGRRLHLELEVDLQLRQDRPQQDEMRDVIIVDGKFTDRDGDFLRSPFQGTISHQTIRDYYDDYRQEYARWRRSGVPREVSGICMVNNQVTDGLWVIPPLELN